MHVLREAGKRPMFDSSHIKVCSALVRLVVALLVAPWFDTASQTREHLTIS